MTKLTSAMRKCCFSFSDLKKLMQTGLLQSIDFCLVFICVWFYCSDIFDEGILCSMILKVIHAENLHSQDCLLYTGPYFFKFALARNQNVITIQPNGARKSKINKGQNQNWHWIGTCPYRLQRLENVFVALVIIQILILAALEM